MTQVFEAGLFGHSLVEEDPRYLQNQIITYIGNKRSLLPLIGDGLEIVKRRLGKTKLRILDLFSGSGVVSRYFKQHASHIISNDLESYSKITNLCYLANASSVDECQLREILASVVFEIDRTWCPGFIAEMYSPRDESRITTEDRVFYTRRNAIYLDTACKAIERVVPGNLRHLLLAPLLADASVHANTSGVFKGFYKSGDGVGQFGGAGRNALSRIMADVQLEMPIFSRFECGCEVIQRDANDLVGSLRDIDVAYMDPPYNQHPYGSNYFMLNLLVDYVRPSEVSRVSGIPTGWNRSRYNQRAESEKAIIDVVRRCPASFVLLSYNSEGYVPYDRFVTTLKKLGNLEILEAEYNTFRGSRNLRDRSIHVTEFLFLLEKN